MEPDERRIARKHALILILVILHSKRLGDPAGAGVELDDLRLGVDQQKAELPPIVGVAVDEKGGSGIRLQVADALESRGADGLGLCVDGDVEQTVHVGEHHRHDVWRAPRVGARQVGMTLASDELFKMRGDD